LLFERRAFLAADFLAFPNQSGAPIDIAAPPNVLADPGSLKAPVLKFPVLIDVLMALLSKFPALVDILMALYWIRSRRSRNGGGFMSLFGMFRSSRGFGRRPVCALLLRQDQGWPQQDRYQQSEFRISCILHDSSKCSR
jgi:hypothetical protein